jgi:hypothetical protein
MKMIRSAALKKYFDGYLPSLSKSEGRDSFCSIRMML